MTQQQTDIMFYFVSNVLDINLWHYHFYYCHLVFIVKINKEKCYLLELQFCYHEKS